ncbi:hypothetical protein FRC03_009066 [Tulasnella sp. 419]|nr:hypothetical protein FRC02_004505 [Tulasnella sp. 418]KAG8967931.1 hypothetical protein FRC03_009066 [Tulasnella sp. 419]
MTSTILLTEEGEMTEKLEQCLGHIFSKYLRPPFVPERDDTTGILKPPINAYLTNEGLDRWAIETNGEPFTAETKEELLMLDSTDSGELTFKGFLQVYQLQTETDEEETWRDLRKHGFNRELVLVIDARP